MRFLSVTGLIAATLGLLGSALQFIDGTAPWTRVLPWALAQILALHLRDYVRNETNAVRRVRVRQLLEGGREWSGIELCSRAGVGPGWLYPELERMAEQGELLCRWGDPVHEDGPRPRLYRLTGGPS